MKKLNYFSKNQDVLAFKFMRGDNIITASFVKSEVKPKKE